MEHSGYVGPGRDHDLVFRGDVAAGQYLAFWLRDARMLAGMNVNTWDVTAAITFLVHFDARVNRARLANPDADLAEVHLEAMSGAHA